LYPTDPPAGDELSSLQTAAAQATEAAAWQRYVPGDEEEPVEERAHWRRESIGFTAMLRLSVALGVGPAAVDEMPIGQFLFLNLPHFATNNVDLIDPERLKVQCAACDHSFLPVIRQSLPG
jgi:hypothetical protein